MTFVEGVNYKFIISEGFKPSRQVMSDTRTRFWQNGKCRTILLTPMSFSAWFDLYSKGDKLKLHKICPNTKGKCHKQFTFLPKQNQLEGAGFRKITKNLRGQHGAWNNIIRPTVNVDAPFISIAVGTKTKKRYIRSLTSDILKSFSEGKILSLTNMHGIGSKLKIM